MKFFPVIFSLSVCAAQRFWEWCLDSYEAKPERKSLDPLALDHTARRRVLRGGSYFSKSAYARCAERQGSPADDKDFVHFFMGLSFW